MESETLRQRLASLIKIDALNFWEIEDHLEELAGFSEEVQEAVLRQVAVIWPVSHSLCYAFLEQVQSGLTCLHPSQLPDWVHAILDVYEEEGLQQARHFMAEVEHDFLCRLRGEAGLSFQETVGRLLPYARGLAGRQLELAVSGETYTDTLTIFLPPEIALFKDKQLNFLHYKLIVSCQWALEAFGTFDLQPGPEDPLLIRLAGRYSKKWSAAGSWLESFFSLFPDPLLSRDLYHLLEIRRVTIILRQELPGLMREAQAVLKRLHQLRPELSGLNGPNQVLEGLRQWTLTGRTKGAWHPREQEVYVRTVDLLNRSEPQSARDSAEMTARLYELLQDLPELYLPAEPLDHQGVLKPAAVTKARLRRRREAGQQFIQALAAILPPQLSQPVPPEEEEQPPGSNARLPGESSIAMLPSPGKEATPASREEVPETQFITIGGQQLKIPEHLKPLAREITQDLGTIPERYLSSAMDLASRGYAAGAAPEVPEGEGISAPLTYDEWDFRRSGFRKNWCVLQEKEIRPVRGTFVEHTLAKYRGLLQQLRRQFELMRTQQGFLRRQRDGDELDLNALTESLVDARAGLSPSEKVFSRLSRDERNIAVVFLVDMSSSTEGWVSTTIKESLVLICEALDVLGDRYAIYGFSGMRRLRCELYHLKHFAEPYDEEVRARIAAISPREYTRMGPPLRHLTRLLHEMDAKIRLLITLSDGKPEDYDDYKGEYAIEDTRHALIEAKAAAIHPFCITIDQQAHDYISHMYGEVNYIFIDEVRKLPVRMPEIYRNLTT